MVKERRIERKVVSLLVDEPKTTPEGKKRYAKKEQQVERFKRTNPVAFAAFITDLGRRFRAFDEKVTKAEMAEIEAFNRRCRGKPR